MKSYQSEEVEIAALKVFKGQEPIKAVNMESRPVTPQWKGTYELEGIHVSNSFNGARVNFAELENDSLREDDDPTKW